MLLNLNLIYFKASKYLDEINFNNFPEPSKLNFQYSKCPTLTTPIVDYLRENEIYDSHGSGAVEDFGVLTKTIFDIQSNRFIRIKIIDANKFKITWIVEDVDELLAAMMTESDFDWRIFDKLGFTSKSKIIVYKYDFTSESDVIEFKFDISDEFIECPDEEIISSGIINYNELKKN